MACRGVHFALSKPELLKLMQASSDSEVLDVVEEIEDRWDEAWLYQTDTAWEAIHRCLTDGNLGFDNGEYPLKLCILGGARLYAGDDYVVSLKTHEDVSSLAESLPAITQEKLRHLYFSIRDSEYSPRISEDDFAYVWDWFNGLPDFYGRAAAGARSVIFTVDQ